MTPHTRYSTADPDEAEQVIADLYLPNRLELPQHPSQLGMEVTAVRLGALTAGRLSYGSPVHLRTADAENFHVNLPLRGRAASSHGNSETVPTHPGEGLVFSPGSPADMWWSADCEQLCLMVPRTLLEDELEQLLGRTVHERLRFDFSADLHSPVGRRWRTVLDLLVAELDEPTEMGRNPHVTDHIESLVLDGLLLSQSHTFTGLAHGREQPGGLSSAIRKAVELVQERPSEPWTTVRLATQVHLSPRALQAGFRRELSVAPMTYVRQVRLRHARRALQAADPHTTTVRAVAVRSGILHMSRFAASYHDAFGERPSETLHRHGSNI